MTDGRLSKNFYEALSLVDNEGLDSLMNVPISRSQFEQAASNHGGRPQRRGRGRDTRGSGRVRGGYRSDTRGGYQSQSRHHVDHLGSERLENSRSKFGSNTSLASDCSMASSSHGSIRKNPHQVYRRRDDDSEYSRNWRSNSERGESSDYNSRSSSRGTSNYEYIKDRDNFQRPYQRDRQQSREDQWHENEGAKEKRKPFWKRMDEEPSSSGEFLKRIKKNQDAPYNSGDRSEDPNDNRERRNRANGRERVRHFGYKYLEELSTKEDHEIIVAITNPKSPFDEYLKNEQLKPDWLLLMLNIIRKVCDSDFKGNRSAVLDKLCKSKFLSIVSTYLGDVGTEENYKTKQNLPTFIGDLTAFYSCLLNTLPMLALEKDLKRIIMKTRIAVDNVEKYLKVTVEEATKEKLQMLDDKFDDYMKLVTEQLPKENKRTFLDRIAECAPPENFRELSLYPTYEDIARQRLGFVRPNIIKGAYDSVEHYLDIQFRLLREDFIDPLRTGLRKYLESKSEPHRRSKFKYDSVRLYPGTRFENVENSKTHQVGILLNFDPDQKMKRVMWDRSKRFMHGSLLVFTVDDFQTFFYGTVLERDLTLLKSGKVLISLTEGAKTDRNFFITPFLMAESEVFFEPYFLIMKLLKELNDETFPMKRYIVEGKPDAVYPPYLYVTPTIKIGGRICDALYTNFWPNADELGLDPFQCRAYKAALTRSFCVIQGPPGTGKTFLGLKIVETIWSNALRHQKQMIEDANNVQGIANDTHELRGEALRRRLEALKPHKDALKLPILIVCYTNHALDQFLEGMLKFTQKIVRVGGQSRSEVLKNYNLRGRNNLAELRSNAGHQISHTMSNVRKAIKTCREEIDRINQIKKSVGLPLGILSVSVLSRVMQENYRKLLETDDDLQMWLLVANENDNQPEFDVENFPDENRRIEEAEVAEESMDVDDEDDEEDTNIVNEDEIFDLNEVSGGNQLGNTRHYSMTVDELGSLCREKIELRNSVKQNERSFLRRGGDYSEYYNMIHQLQNDILQLMNQYQELKKRLENPILDEKRAKVLLQQHPQMMSPNSRWILYWYWVSQLRQIFAKRLEELEAEHRNKMIQYEEYRQMEDLHVVKQADVIGMTTTGAARLNLLLKSLHPTVVVVEEAAEVLEAHIVASLTQRCQQVILIGDHEQLKPSTAVYELSLKYNINVSLFERMIKNGMDCPMLNVQHRMRPEISCLITPLIYPTLKNHDSVYEFESVRGVKKNVFFVDHKEYEQVLDENQTKQNIHEAQFMIALARYLVQQGYNPENITVLTTYTGQMFLLRQLKKENFLLNYLKCVVVDKYQGEENEIILLSLVRSNAENKIGFLNIKNRVCVALSRAKKGLYIVGNMDCLTKSSDLWVSIRKTLEENKAIGNALELYCSKHDELTMVASAKDFDAVKEGGCNRYCNELMACGHLCPSLCHILNQNHESIKCREPCKNTCPRNHPCKLFCYEKCAKCTVLVELTLPCEHKKRLPCHIDESTYPCDVMVDDVSPFCKHKVKRKCHQKVEDVQCPEPCEDRLDCGHACTRNCHKNDDPDHIEFKCRKPCEKRNKNCNQEHICQKLCFEECGNCIIKIKVKLNCGHETPSISCSTDVSKLKCYKKCENRCDDCKNRCKKQCWQDCKPCNFVVKKTIPECGHNANMECSTPPTRERCNAKCERLAPCGHQCKSMCRKPCGNEKCMEIVKFRSNRTACGHQYIYAFCYQSAEVPNNDPKKYLLLCREPCDELLECGDPCGGTCGECWQGRLHRTCNKKCGAPLICGHICKFPCRQLCPPCTEPCSFVCKHSRCPKKCGVPCVLCKEPCEWQCEHYKCTKKCGDPCNRPPCEKPCPLKIEKCGHDCIGFCGEPCPPLCRLCDPEVTEIMFGYEDEEDARFVLLEDCEHVIESQALDQHLSTAPEGGEIVMKVCPLCKTPIKKTLRYMNYVKQTYRHMMNVKKQIFGDGKQIKAKIHDLTWKLQRLQASDLNFFSDVDELQLFVIQCISRISTGQNVSQRDLSAITYYSDIFTQIVSRKKEFKKQNEVANELFSFLNRLLNRLKKTGWCVNRQLMLDFGDELRRYHRIVDFCKLLENPLYTQYKNDGKVSTMSASIRETLFGFRKFTQIEEEMVIQLFGNLEKELKSPKSLTSAEKRMINEAMKKDFYGGGSGHWFTCSKGHYYVITECGGAMQKANCPECGEVIGGNDHRYVPTARLASDMDGASQPAFPSGRNMLHHFANR